MRTWDKVREYHEVLAEIDGVVDFESKKIYLLYGEEWTGKTFLSLYISKQVMDGGGKVLYVDTKTDLPDKLKKYTKRGWLDPEQLNQLFNLKICPNKEKFEDVFFNKLGDELSEEYDLLVIDTLIEPYPVSPNPGDSTGNGMHWRTRTKYFKANIFPRLKALVEKYGLIGILTTDSYRDWNKGGDMVPEGGNALIRKSNTDILLKHVKKPGDLKHEVREVRVDGTVNYKIRANGFSIEKLAGGGENE